MQYRPLGQTGLNVSVLSFGASSLGGVFHSVKLDECIETVHAALDGGINFIDVSPAYGGTRAEKVLGRALEGVDRNRYILADEDRQLQRGARRLRFFPREHGAQRRAQPRAPRSGLRGHHPVPRHRVRES